MSNINLPEVKREVRKFMKENELLEKQIGDLKYQLSRILAYPSIEMYELSEKVGYLQGDERRLFRYIVNQIKSKKKLVKGINKARKKLSIYQQEAQEREERKNNLQLKLEEVQKELSELKKQQRERIDYDSDFFDD